MDVVHRGDYFVYITRVISDKSTVKNLSSIGEIKA